MKTRLNKIIHSAFTVFEILIVLSLISAVAGLTVPRIISTSQRASRRGQLQTIYMAISDHFYDENIKGDNFLDRTDRWQTLQNKIQYSQACSFGVGKLAPCLPEGVQDNNLVGGGAFRLSNGMIVYGILSDPNDEEDGFYVDINGDEGPNLGGQGGNTVAALADDCNDRFRFNINHITGEVRPAQCTTNFLNG